MKRLYLSRWFAVLTLATALVPGVRSAARADAVTDWNAIMEATLSAPPTNPVFQSRWNAIVQLAVFEAVNAITGDYEPYLGLVEAPASASPEAAAIAAAHRTLVVLRPGSAEVLDDLRAASLAAVPDGPEKEAGIEVGEDAAAILLELRADDGSGDVVPYTPGTNPGDWQPAPPGFAPAFLPGWGDVTPFALEDGSQFLLPPPPALHTGKYENDYYEVMLLGRIDSPLRPQDRTDVARFYAVSSPTLVWNQAARQASADQGLTLSENARVFALLGMALGDGAISAFNTKYHYNLWRPVTAIRNGDIDGNDRTEADPEWLPLITTPAFPSYASAHATLSNAARIVLERTFGTHGHDVILTNPSLPDIVLEYSAWDEITDDIDDARIYGGIHFRFDQEAGSRQGRHIGLYLLENYLRSPDELEDE